MGITHRSGVDGTWLLESLWLENHKITGSINPETDGSASLGDSTLRYSTIHVSDLKSLATILPYSSTVGIYIKDAAGTNRIRLYNLDGDFVVAPVTNNTGNLGWSTYNWKEINAKTINCETLNAQYGVVYNQKMMWVDAGFSDTPGDTNWHAIGSTVTYAPFNYLKPAYARVVGRVEADEASASSVHIYNATIGEIAALSWTGTGAQNIAGTWTAFTDTTDRPIYVRYKASSATETLKIYSCDFQVRVA